MDFKRYLKEYPNKEGRFGKFGGAYLPEKLVPAFEEINEAYLTICHSSRTFLKKCQIFLFAETLRRRKEKSFLPSDHPLH